MVRNSTFTIDEEGNLVEPSKELPVAIQPEEVEQGLSIAERLMQETSDLEDLITPEQRQADAYAESSRSLVLMQRVALVFADVSDDRPVAEKLETAGCPQPVYFQMRDMPEFKACLHKALVDYIVLPRAGKMLAAMTKAATMGDSRAFQKAMDFAQMLDTSTVDEMADEMARITDKTALAREIHTTLEDVQKLVEDLGLKPAQKEAQDKAAAHVVQNEPPKRTQLVDHAAVRKDEIQDATND